MTIRYDKDGKIATITIQRPEVMNALDRETFRTLGEALLDFDRDEEVLVAILTGAGDKAFSAGADLKKMYGRSEDGSIREIWGTDRQWRLGQGLQVWKPVIAAINGYCLAGGLELLLTGARITAQDAYRLGIVSRVVPPAELLPTTRQLADKICQNGPLAVRVTKELAWRGLEMSLEEGLRLYAALGALVHASEDAREGPQAFTEKRQPRFKGR